MDPLDITESSRPLRYGADPPPPIALLMEERAANAQAMDDLLADVACERFLLEQVLREMQVHSQGDEPAREAIGIILDRMADLLSRHQVTATDPTGSEWSSSMLAQYKLIGSAQSPDVTVARIVKTDRPLVLRFGKCIRRGWILVEAPLARGPAALEPPTPSKGD